MQTMPFTTIILKLLPLDRQSCQSQWFSEPRNIFQIASICIQSEEIKRDPEMDKSAVCAGSGGDHPLGLQI